MTGRSFAGVLARYGRDVTVYSPEEPQGVTCRAFFQPVRERGTEQSVPAPLGLVKRDRFLYLGPAGTALDDGGTCRIEVGGEVYRPETVQAVWAGGEVHHWRAVLTRRAEEVAG